MGKFCYYLLLSHRPTGLLSCCRGKGFGSPGCKTSRHDSAVMQLIRMKRDNQDEVTCDSSSNDCCMLPPILGSVVHQQCRGSGGVSKNVHQTHDNSKMLSEPLPRIAVNRSNN